MKSENVSESTSFSKEEYSIFAPMTIVDTRAQALAGHALHNREPVPR